MILSTVWVDHFVQFSINTDQYWKRIRDLRELWTDNHVSLLVLQTDELKKTNKQELCVESEFL